MILANGLLLVSVLVSAGLLQRADPNVPAWVVWPVFSLAVLNIVFAIALLASQRWGFFGLVVTTLGAFGLNVYLGFVIPHGLAGLMGIVILYVLLRIGGEKSAWSQMDCRPN